MGAGNNFPLCLRAGHLMVEQSEPAAGPLMGRRVGEPADPLACGKERCAAAPRGRARDGFSRIRSPYRSQGKSGTYKVTSGCCAK